jgi:hypothetical protein
MTNPIDTSKNARDMSEQEKQAFLAKCRKLDAAPPKPVETPASAKDMTPTQRDAWMADHRRRWR